MIPPVHGNADLTVWHIGERKKHGGNAATLRHYWTKGEGLAKWAESPTPFRTLVSHLVKYVNDPEGLAAEYYHDVFHVWPGRKFAKGGKGKRK